MFEEDHSKGSQSEEEERQREELEADIAQKTTDFNSFITSFKTMVIESVSKMHRQGYPDFKKKFDQKEGSPKKISSIFETFGLP